MAIALKLKGFDPLVVERRSAEQVGNEGIFLTLAPNGLNALRGLGLADEVAAQGVLTTGILLHNERGKPLGFIDYAAHGTSFGAPSTTVRRGALGTILLSAAGAAGVELRFGCAIEGVSETGDGVTVGAGGQSDVFDILVAADGLRSTVRRLALPSLPQPVYNGLIGSGGIVDVPQVPPTGGRMLMTFGRQAFFGYIKDRDGPVYWFDSYPSPVERQREPDPASLARFLQGLHRDDPLDNYRIIASESAVTHLYPDYDIPSLPHWFTDRVVLVGDAAHAVTPHSGQGASMALEDALVLTACLDAEQEPRAAFHRFESLRRARVEAAVALGRQGGQSKKAQSWWQLRLRDLILPLVIPLGRSAQEKFFAFRADQAPLALP